MNAFIQPYEHILAKVKFFAKQLKLKIRKSTGRPLTISPPDTLALSIFKQTNGIPTKTDHQGPSLMASDGKPFK